MTHNDTEPMVGDLFVWYLPQLGSGLKFVYPVADLVTGAAVLDALGKFALYEFRNGIKGDYADVGGINRYEDLGYGEQAWCGVDEAEITAARGATRASVGYVVGNRRSDGELTQVRARVLTEQAARDAARMREYAVFELREVTA
ncbi:hypothetical protein [Nocardia sp. CA-145437]|uniref:hypothetical protein n=1 Tax=Nocardia sp. CA-145437 TaxID=3239980 RepID=UPI003D987857